MSISLLLISAVILQNVDLTLTEGAEVGNSMPNLNEKVTLHFVDVDVMLKTKREAKKSNLPYYQRANSTMKVFRRSKIRKKLPRRFAKYRHSTRVIRGMPAIVLLPPFYRRPMVQNFTVRPPAMMEHPDPVPVAPIEMPTPQPEPLVRSDFQQNTSPRAYSSDYPSSFSYSPQSPTQQNTSPTAFSSDYPSSFSYSPQAPIQQNTSPRAYSSDYPSSFSYSPQSPTQQNTSPRPISSDYPSSFSYTPQSKTQRNTSPRTLSSEFPSSHSFAPQSQTQPLTTQYFTEVTSASHEFIPTTPFPSTELEHQIDWNEEHQTHSVDLHSPPDNENSFTITTYNNTDIMYDQPPESPVQYLLPPLWPNFDESSVDTSNHLKNDFTHDVNINNPIDPLPQKDSGSFVTTEVTTAETVTPYNELEDLKPPIYSDSYFWTDYQNQSVYDVEVNNALTLSGGYNNGNVNDTKSAPYVDVNLSLLASEVASMGMKVEATAKAIEMARDVMRNQGVAPSSEVTQQRREDTESPLAVAESGYFGLQNGKYTETSEPAVKKAKKKKPHKRPSDEVIPGVAGQDYPLYASPPTQPRNIPCNEGFGYIPDPSTRCQVFYVCTGPGMGEPMLCPNGTLFSKDFLVCDWWYNVECLPN